MSFACEPAGSAAANLPECANSHVGRRRHAARRRSYRARGQGLVEFALVLTPLTLLMLAVVQLGLIFNTYVTLSNGVREGARSASIYMYDRARTKSQNDTSRAITARDVMVSSMGLLKVTAPQLASSQPSITYTVPAGTSDSDTRAGEEVTIHVHYDMDLILPLIADLLPLESGRLPMDAQITVVIN